MSDIDKNKQIIQDFIQVVWTGRNLSALKDFCAENCVTMQCQEQTIGKRISTSVIRIDRVQDGKIVEHWSVSDAAGLMQQIQD
jgi:predicted ester cyclase